MTEIEPNPFPIMPINEYRGRNVETGEIVWLSPGVELEARADTYLEYLNDYKQCVTMAKMCPLGVAYLGAKILSNIIVQALGGQGSEIEAILNPSVLDNSIAYACAITGAGSGLSAWARKDEVNYFKEEFQKAKKRVIEYMEKGK